MKHQALASLSGGARLALPMLHSELDRGLQERSGALRGQFPRARTDVAEILRSPAPTLTPRHVQILRALCVPDHKLPKEMAFDLGITLGTWKCYVGHLFRRLGWKHGTQRMLVLWALAHREMLGIDAPTPEQFDGVSGGHLTPAFRKAALTGPDRSGLQCLSWGLS